MASSTPTSPSRHATSAGRRDRPWLLPTNRKLRNLVSISIRNVSLEQAPSTRRRTKTIDDEAIPQTLKSPAKMVALREHKALEHSRSSTDLRSAGVAAAVGETADETNGSPIKATKERHSNAVQRTPPRPNFRMRRRSTLEWANATPQSRQEKLERVTGERMADVFFSLHVDGVEEPIYISETAERTMNPTFRHIDFSACGPAIMRLDGLTLRIWAKSIKGQQWRQLLELSLALQGLQYLGKSLDRIHQSLPPNAVIFHLTDGVYTSFTSLTDYVPAPVAAPARANSSRVLPTASFDALLRLAKLDDSIQDALATRDKLAADLENLLQTNKQALDDRDRVAEGDDRLKTIDFAKKVVVKQLDKARKQHEEKRASLDNRRRLMKEDTQRRQSQHEQIQRSRPELPTIRDGHEIKRKAIDNQRRRVCEDIQACYPINPIPKQSLSFTIRDLYLPNSDNLDTSSPETVAAALGHTAHVVSTLSHYLSQPLVYALHLRGSTSTISDAISLLKTSASTTQRYSDEVALRTYPLYSRGVPRFRFEYGVFLLNKNIQILLETVYAIRVLDIRHTLPNLKYLLYVATAGEGELPARKAGGVRGLLRVKGEGRPGGSRSGSEGSTNSALSGILWHGGTTNANGKAKGAVESLRRNMGKV